MNGRTEKEIQSNEKMKEKLKTLPPIFSEFYYYMYTTKSYNTIDKYILYVQNFAMFVGDGVIQKDFYKKVTPSIINQHFAKLKYTTKNGQTYATSDSFKTTLWSAYNTFFDFLVKNEYLKTNPMEKTSRPAMKDKPEIAYLNEQEMQALISNIKNKSKAYFLNRDLSLITLGLTTGMRVSALVQINVEDVDLENNIVRVVEKRGKVCNIMFGEQVKQHLAVWLHDRDYYFPDLKTDALFISNYQKRMTTDGVRVILKKYSKGITDKKVTPHVMRHTCATNLYEKTGDIYLCASVLNHENIATTQRYAAMSQDRKKNAAKILDNML